VCQEMKRLLHAAALRVGSVRGGVSTRTRRIRAVRPSVRPSPHSVCACVQVRAVHRHCRQLREGEGRKTPDRSPCQVSVHAECRAEDPGRARDGCCEAVVHAGKERIACCIHKRRSRMRPEPTTRRQRFGMREAAGAREPTRRGGTGRVIGRATRETPSMRAPTASERRAHATGPRPRPRPRASPQKAAGIAAELNQHASRGCWGCFPLSCIRSADCMHIAHASRFHPAPMVDYGVQVKILGSFVRLRRD